MYYKYGGQWYAWPLWTKINSYVFDNTNFYEDGRLHPTEVLMARATLLLHIYTRIALKNNQQPGLRRREIWGLERKTVCFASGSFK